MPRIIVKNTQVHEREFTGDKGKNIIRTQMACIDRGDGYELPFRVGLGKNPPYQAGEYDFAPDSFELSKYGDPVLKRYFDLLRMDHKPAPALPAKP